MNPLTLSVLHLSRHNRDALADTADLCRMHTRIIDATTGMPDSGHRTLWAQPTHTTLVIRATSPVTPARLPRGYTTTITHRPWTPPDRPGRWVMAGTVNPGRNNYTGGPTRNQPDRARTNAQPVLYNNPDEQAAWLARRIDGATLLDWRVTNAAVSRGRHHTGRTVTVRRVQIRALWHVHDPQAMASRLLAGVGIDKTWGCGLTVWTPMGDSAA